jgi:hypothetical protein
MATNHDPPVNPAGGFWTLVHLALHFFFLTQINALGDEVVVIHVGNGAEVKRFTVHKKLICEASIVFEKMFTGCFLEGQTNSATLPEDDPLAFGAIINRLYTGKLLKIADTYSANTFNEDILVLDHLYNIVVLGEKYDLPEMVDRAVTGIISFYDTGELSPSTTGIRWVMQRCSKKSKLRLYLAKKVFQHWIHSYSLQNEKPDSTSLDSNSALCELLSDQDILMEVIKAGRMDDNSREREKCQFH